jgi:hypothetical protein
MRKLVFVFLVFSVLLLFGCSGKQEYPFSYVGERNGQSIYLDDQKGKIIYLDETNRIIDYVDLRPNSSDISLIEKNKTAALQNIDRGKKDIPGQDYSVTLSTRYYSNRLLYIMDIEPYNDNTRRFANSVSVELSDSKGFLLGEISSSYNWTNIVDDEGKRVSMQTQGSIPITLRNYLEIVSWGPKWSLQN